jgi:hypothetical protein
VSPAAHASLHARLGPKSTGIDEFKHICLISSCCTTDTFARAPQKAAQAVPGPANAARGADGFRPLVRPPFSRHSNGTMSQTARTTLLALLAALLALAVAGAASAQTAAGAAGDIGDAEVSVRLARIEADLDDGKALANFWWFGWMSVQFGSAGLFGGLAIAYHDEPDAPVNAVNGCVSLLSGASMLIMPAVPAYAPYELRKLPEETPEARRAKLAAAEDWLRRSAEYEETGRAWYMHLINFAAAAAAGLIIAFAFDGSDWKDGLYNFGLLFATGELQVATQPTRAIRDWKAYKRLYRPLSIEF